MNLGFQQSRRLISWFSRLKRFAKLLDGKASGTDKSAQEASIQLSMVGDGERHNCTHAAQNHVTAALTHHTPPKAAESIHRLSPRYHREGRH